MSNQIFESRTNRRIEFFFNDLYSWNDFELIANYIENIIKAKLIKKFDGIWNRFAIYKKNVLEFELHHDDDFGNRLNLLDGRNYKNDENNNKELRIKAQVIAKTISHKQRIPPPDAQFKVNEYISLKLINDYTIVFIDRKPFHQCLGLYELIPYDLKDTTLSPKEVFWGHCSNLQAWAEHDYDTRLIHHNLAFPLLKELTKVGDPKAIIVFKEEIASRLKSNHLPVIQYLVDNYYLNYFNKEEKEEILSDFDHINLNGEFIPVVGTKLTLNGKDITNIEEIKGLEKCTYLENLNLSQNKIKTIEGIDKLIKLKNLSLNVNLIQKIEGLNSLSNLLSLNLRHNQIKKIDGLLSLTNLRSLDLDYNQIKKIEKLSHLTKLERISINYNQIRKIEGLENLNQLEILFLRSNRIKKIKGLNSAIELKKIYLWKNNIEKIDGLNLLTNLTNLELNDNHIRSTEGLERNINLTFLNLGYNKIPEIKGLVNLSKLTYLSLCNNFLKEIRGLGNLKKIQTLDLSYNEISEIKGLSNLRKITFLDLRENQISELKGLENLEYPVEISLYGNPLNREAKILISKTPYEMVEQEIVKYCRMKSQLKTIQN